MKSALVLAALLAGCGVAFAQNSWDPAADSGGAADSAPGPDASQPPDPPAAAAPQAPGFGGPRGGGDSGAPAPMSLGDARLNIGSIVQAFVDARSRGGAWLLRDKTTKRVRRLSLQSLDPNTTEPAGEQRYEADAVLKDLDTGEALHAQFVADFTGPEWKIVGLRLFEAPKKKGKRG